MVSEELSLLMTATSSMPSPLKSPVVTAAGFGPTGKVALGLCS
jgi:hypothetical protein